MDSGHVDGSISGPDPGSNPKDLHQNLQKQFNFIQLGDLRLVILLFNCAVQNKSKMLLIIPRTVENQLAFP